MRIFRSIGGVTTLPIAPRIWTGRYGWDGMSRTDAIRLAVIGAGLIGQRHIRNAFTHPDFQLVWIADPDPSCLELAEELGCNHAANLVDIPMDECDAAIVATPNSNHLASALLCLEKTWATLVEKPIADTIENGEKLVRAFERFGVHLLIGHHRRYHPFVEKAQELIATAVLGSPISASIIWAVRKPERYFEASAWRKGHEGGPLLINFIHEADLLLGLFGPAQEVQAITSNTARGGPVEDSAAILIRFASGVLATVMVSDAALTPWSFESASGENPTIAENSVSSWRIGCTAGSFEFPQLRVWKHTKDDEADWSQPLQDETFPTTKVDPLHEQLTHFAQLIRGQINRPKISGRDGLEALRLVEAVHTASQTGHQIFLDRL